MAGVDRLMYYMVASGVRFSLGDGCNPRRTVWNIITWLTCACCATCSEQNAQDYGVLRTWKKKEYLTGGMYPPAQGDGNDGNTQTHIYMYTYIRDVSLQTENRI